MTQLIVEQALNGLQFGLMLFLLAAGLTLVFGIMDMINLAHGSLYMAGAYLAAAATQASGSFVVGIGAAMVGTALLGALLEIALLRRLYARNHPGAGAGDLRADPDLQRSGAPDLGRAAGAAQRARRAFRAGRNLGGFFYPAYRLLIIAVGALVARAALRAGDADSPGHVVRAGASNREMTEALRGSTCAGCLPGSSPSARRSARSPARCSALLAVQVGMGESILILAFVVIVIGGIGSIRGALVGSRQACIKPFPVT